MTYSMDPVRKIAALLAMCAGAIASAGPYGGYHADSDDDSVEVYEEAVRGNTAFAPRRRKTRPARGWETAGGRVGLAIVRVARRQIGVRYHFGGKTPLQGFDCSGLVWYTHRQNGITVPRNSHRQLQAARPVRLSRIRPGDLLFFDLGTRKISHVGIYVGNGRFIHAPSSGKRVTYARLDNPYWRERLVAAGRFHR